ncbi:GSCFA domain-containing protein [Flagellimonas nanhaiensis]|uniref:GSCFA domain-containing protein n=1 Tax=Flagellimonas nanhaiensis TaxID=2292706 RepID=A0A371JP26_9FLAO|nr:GSCFA domain-containing protein [Allomuricauda nanhaiensis]RDY59274.1 GSCFA domain-containing protein [Allomuricauda nanhaiensis]
MRLQTSVPLQKDGDSIDYKSKLLLLGSCFAENIGEKLDYFQFQSLQNPFGILYHPLAIENLVKRALYGKTFQEDEVFEQEGIWYCFEVHSDLRSSERQALVKELNEALQTTLEYLQTTTHLIITLGTAWAYRHKSTGNLVANCHKVPQKEFSKELLTVKTIKDSLENLVSMIERVNPKLQIVSTISPVRHLRDGFIENQRSKANLIFAVHEMENESTVTYFPAYEIMMDELRDYRFYAKDMVHPNDLAVDYIWEKFKTVWISEDSKSTMDDVEAVRKGLQHRPFNPETDAHQSFLKSLEAKIAGLQERYPFMKFE